MHGISVVIITKNEADNIGRCLQSLQEIADEIIVIDSFSEDRTAEICSEFKVQFLQMEWQGYAQTKNHGNALAKFSHILWIDADEVLSEQLKTSLLAAKTQLKDGYTINRLNNWCGKWIHHGSWYPDRRLRLFPKEKAIWKGDFVHEYLAHSPKLSTTHLKGDLLHYSYKSIEEHWQRARKYALLGANEVAQSNKKALFLRAVFSPIISWCKGYFVKGGFRDGKAGWTIARITAWEKWLKYSQAGKIRKG